MAPCALCKLKLIRASHTCASCQRNFLCTKMHSIGSVQISLRYAKDPEKKPSK